REDRMGDGRVRLTQVLFLDGQLQPIQMASTSKHLVIALEYERKDGRTVLGMSFEIGVYNLLGQLVFSCGNNFAGKPFERMPATGRLLCHIPNLPLLPGLYDVNVFCGSMNHAADWVKDAARL